MGEGKIGVILNCAYHVIINIITICLSVLKSDTYYIPSDLSVAAHLPDIIQDMQKEQYSSQFDQI